MVSIERIHCFSYGAQDVKQRVVRVKHTSEVGGLELHEVVDQCVVKLAGRDGVTTAVEREDARFSERFSHKFKGQVKAWKIGVF